MFAAYLFRNVAARDRLLDQVRELLAPGGVLVVHEYAVRGDRARRAGLGRWSAGRVIIPLGVLTAPRSRIYRYLWRSVLDFDSAERLPRPDGRAPASTASRSRTFGGWQPGVLHTFLGRRRPGRAECPRAALASRPRPARACGTRRAAAARGDDGGRHHVVVVGGGIAGLAAATGLAERGVRVTLLEREDQLGGRVASWPVESAGGARPR